MLGRATSHISSTERADPDDFEAYADAAWDAGIDPSDAVMSPWNADDDPSTIHHRAVIEYWDLEMRDLMVRMTVANLLSRGSRND